MDKKINIGFIGYGYWGKNIFRNLMNMKNVEVCSICDSNPNTLKAIQKEYPNEGFKKLCSYDSILLDENIDAVVIATPPQTHFTLAKKALFSNKHVFVEKPMTTDSDDAKRLHNIAELRSLKLMVGHTFLYNPAINDVKNLIDKDELGKIHYVDFVMTNLGKYQLHNVLWDLAPHGVSIVLHLLNNPEVVNVEANGIEAIQKNLIDVAYLTMYFKNGSFANIHFSWLNPNKERKLTVVGSKKMVVFDDIDPLKKIWIYDKGIEDEKNFTSWGDSIVGYRHGNIIIPKCSTGEPLKIELEHFIDCILNDKEPLTNGKHGAKVIEIIEQANRKLKCKN